MSPRNGSRILLSCAVLCVNGFLLPLASSRARAEISGCRSDPVIVLSNGVTLDVTDSIGTAASNVQRVSYWIYAPAGTKPLSIVNTSGVIGPKEYVYFSATAAANTYRTKTYVATTTTGIAVSETTVATKVTATSTATINGHDHQYLTVTVTL